MKKSYVFALLVCLSLAADAMAQGGRGDLRRNRRPIANHYIVVVADGYDPEAVGLESQALRRGRLKRVYRNTIRGFSIQLSAADATSLSRDPRVLYVEEDGVVQASDTQTSAPWGLDRIDQRLLPLNGAFTYPAPNTTVYVHVIDTGIRATHLDFGGRASIFRDYIDDDGDGDPTDVNNDDADPLRPDGADCHGHGTHVASTIAGNTYGAAKSARILSHRVLNCQGNGSTSGIIAALDAAAADSRRPAVANLSLGGDASTSLDSAVGRAVAAGITVVVAAGNSSIDAATVSPARAAAAITVGATGVDDARAAFSNFGSVLDLFAPGVSVPAAFYGDDSGVVLMSGTSMAAPHVAGLAAVYLSAVGNKPAAQVRDVLVSAASPVVTGAGTGSPTLLAYSGFMVNSAPTVTITAPASGASAVAPAAFTVTATATDSDGSVSQVAFYANGSPVGSDAVAPFSVSWSNVPAGSYSLTAVAVDNEGASTTSATVSVTVNAAPPPPGSRVNVAAAVNGGTASASSSLGSGFPASGAINGEHLGTDWERGGGWADANPHSFPDWLQVTFSGARTIDEADIYSVQSTYWAPTAPTSTMTSPYSLRDFHLEYWTGSAWQPIPGAGVTGNTLVWRRLTFPAVTTSAIRLVVTATPDGYSRVVELQVYSGQAVPANRVPTVALSAPASGATAVAPAAFGVTATATDSDGTIAQVVFYANGAVIGTDATAPYTLTWSNVSAGDYVLTAVATDNLGAEGTSPDLRVTVTAGSGGVRTNVAAAANGGTASASSALSSGFPASGAINGEHLGTDWERGGGWADANPHSFPDWLQVTFSGAKTIDAADVYSVQGTYWAPTTPTGTMTSPYSLRDFHLEYWTGMAWQPVAGTAVTGNTLVWRRLTFPAVTTSAIRLVVTATPDGYSRVVEINVYGQ